MYRRHGLHRTEARMGLALLNLLHDDGIWIVSFMRYDLGFD
jgi:hypothetical protein